MLGLLGQLNKDYEKGKVNGMIGKCPRCIGGQTSPEYDNGWTMVCIQCGAIFPLKNKVGDSKELQNRYKVELSSDHSPDTMTCIRYNTIPMFARLQR